MDDQPLGVDANAIAVRIEPREAELNMNDTGRTLPGMPLALQALSFHFHGDTMKALIASAIVLGLLAVPPALAQTSGTDTTADSPKTSKAKKSKKSKVKRSTSKANETDTTNAAGEKSREGVTAK